MKVTDVNELKNIAKKVRVDILDEIYYAKSGHPGGALSCADILTVLYFNEMKLCLDGDERNNLDETIKSDIDRDRFILSKGHASAGLYAVLAERGFFSKDLLHSFRSINGKLQGHPSLNTVNGIDMTTGSLGQGLSVANGMAIASKIDKINNRVYCLMGDGELEEGQIWEACMTASKYKLDNLCAIVDCNNLQLTGDTESVKGLDYSNIEDKFKSFGFNTVVINGNNIEEILEAFKKARNVKEKPTCIIAKTIKGKGVSFMENNVSWHGKAPSEEEYKKAIEEINKN